ncbi:hypothetical protein Aglo01_25780 [Actinokineospora globicatena]|nr:hypothetical protein Aglo01_25780 [Actinokineospora globicatena]
MPGAAVYLDGLDQAASVDPMLFQWLEDALTTPSARQVRWRLACRSAAWDAPLAEALRRTFPGFAEWSLLPLDREAARAAVERAIASPGFDGTEFLRALTSARLGRLSACVGQLIDVAGYWHNQGELPRNAVAATEYEIIRLLKERDRRRRRPLPADRAMRLAKRLGAYTMFGGTQALTVAPVGDNATIAVDDLPSEPDPAEPNRPVDPGDYREVLDSVLFTAGPSGSVVFQHQRYVEYEVLAAIIDAVYPDLLGTQDLVRILRPHKTTPIGGYHKTLRNLAGHIPEADLVLFARWLADRTTRENVDEDRFGELHTSVVQRLFEHADDDVVRDALARLAAAGVKAGRRHHNAFPWAGGPVDRRRALAIAVASSGTDPWYTIFALALLTVDDIDWLLDVLPSLPPEATGALSTCIAQLVREPSTRIADRILTLPPSHPAYTATNYLRGQVAVDSEAMAP